MNYTLEQAKQDCIEMWLWLRENPTLEKEDYLNLRYDLDFFSDCPCCEYAKQKNSLKDCSCCPIKCWGYKTDDCLDDFSFYNMWEKELNFKRKINERQKRKRIIYATEILKQAINIKVEK